MCISYHIQEKDLPNIEMVSYSPKKAGVICSFHSPFHINPNCIFN